MRNLPVLAGRRRPSWSCWGPALFLLVRCFHPAGPHSHSPPQGMPGGPREGIDKYQHRAGKGCYGFWYGKHNSCLAQCCYMYITHRLLEGRRETKFWEPATAGTWNPNLNSQILLPNPGQRNRTPPVSTSQLPTQRVFSLIPSRLSATNNKDWKKIMGCRKPGNEANAF